MPVTATTAARKSMDVALRYEQDIRKTVANSELTTPVLFAPPRLRGKTELAFKGGILTAKARGREEMPLFHENNFLSTDFFLAAVVAVTGIFIILHFAL